MICEDIPMITPGSQHTELAVMPSTVSNYSIPGSVGASRDGAMVTSRDNMMTSRQSSLGTGTFNSLERVNTMDKMTESVETQVIYSLILYYD